jgi:hypothetical protein
MTNHDDITGAKERYSYIFTTTGPIWMALVLLERQFFPAFNAYIHNRKYPNIHMILGRESKESVNWPFLSIVSLIHLALLTKNSTPFSFQNELLNSSVVFLSEMLEPFLFWKFPLYSSPWRIIKTMFCSVFMYSRLYEQHLATLS